jgi:D-tyrosyl-tRNA(Tyr) deacylase
MRAVIQRVAEASVTIGADVCGAIGNGLLVYLGVSADDTERDAAYLADKVRHVRIFTDENDKLNRDVLQAGGEVLVVSAFTVCADARRGRRPSFDSAAPPDIAQHLYERFCEEVQGLGVIVRRGKFREYMHVRSINDGPICILLDSPSGGE